MQNNIRSTTLNSLKGKCELGKLIVKELYVQGKNQSWLAKQIETSDAYISGVLSGKYSVSVKQLKKIANVLKIKEDCLINLHMKDFNS